MVKIYEDRVSGKRGESGREAFKEMFAAAARRDWDCLLFWSLDRFSREGAFPTLRYLTRLSELGVSYRSYTEEYINSTGIFGDVIVSLLATLAKQETIRLSERTKAGLERQRHSDELADDRDWNATTARCSGCTLPGRALPRSPENWGSARPQSIGSLSDPLNPQPRVGGVRKEHDAEVAFEGAAATPVILIALVVVSFILPVASFWLSRSHWRASRLLGFAVGGRLLERGRLCPGRFTVLEGQGSVEEWKFGTAPSLEARQDHRMDVCLARVFLHR